MDSTTSSAVPADRSVHTQSNIFWKRLRKKSARSSQKRSPLQGKSGLTEFPFVKGRTIDQPRLRFVLTHCDWTSVARLSVSHRRLLVTKLAILGGTFAHFRLVRKLVT